MVKIRARKTNRNTSYDLEDFLLKEFSKDKEKYVHDEELSCNQCYEVEDIESNKDSIKSFLVKFKADQLSDPKAVRPGLSGFTLPADYNYILMKVDSFFKSIEESHYVLKSTEDELKGVVSSIHKDNSLHVKFTKIEVNEYLLASYEHANWSRLLQDKSKTNWRDYIGKLLKKNLIDNYGKIDSENITEALRVDKIGYIKNVKEVNEFDGFNSNELKLLSPHL